MALAELPVRRRLRVGVFFTGDELVQPGEPLPPGAIYNSNRYALRALLEGLGCEVRDLGTVPDQLEATREALRRAADDNDLIITSGGVSTLYATLYAAPPSWSRDALAEGIAAGTTLAPDTSKIRRADVETAALVAAGDFGSVRMAVSRYTSASETQKPLAVSDSVTPSRYQASAASRGEAGFASR